MLGGFDAWLQSSLGGLDSVVNATTGGWEVIVARVSPEAAAVLKQGSVYRTTPFGNASLTWTMQSAADGLNIQLFVPVGSVAEVHAPVSIAGLRLLSIAESDAGVVARVNPDRSVAEFKQDVERPPWLKHLETKANAVVVVVGPGQYRFTAAYR